MIFDKVDLPEPDSPIIPINSFFLILRDVSTKNYFLIGVIRKTYII